MTTIHDFVRNNQLSLLQEYLQSGKDINVKDKLQRTPLHLAAWSGHFEILSFLLQHEANIQAKAMDGFNALHFAVQSNGKEAVECVRLLCKKGKGNSGGLLHQRITKGNKTALHLAVTKGNAEIITILLEFGLDPLAKTSSGQTAMDLAKDPAIKQLLMKFVESHSKAKPSGAVSTTSVTVETSDATMSADIQSSSSPMRNYNKTEGSKIEEGKGSTSNSEFPKESSVEQTEKRVAVKELPIAAIIPTVSSAPPSIASTILSILQKRKDPLVQVTATENTKLPPPATTNTTHESEDVNEERKKPRLS